jgi:hypothetical protein
MEGRSERTHKEVGMRCGGGRISASWPFFFSRARSFPEAKGEYEDIVNTALNNIGE